MERVLRDLGRRVAEVRVSRGLTQDGLATRVGVSLRFIQAIEGGTQNCTVRTLTDVANGLGVRPGELFAPPSSRAVRRGRPPKSRAESA